MMKSFFGVLTLLLFFTTPLFAQDSVQKPDFTMRAGYFTLAGLTAMDVDLSRDAINHGAREINFMYRWAEDKPGLLGASIGVSSAAVGLASYKLHKDGHKKLARWVLWTSNVVKGVIVYHNWKVSREARRR